jgi:hypothetical protein
LLTTLSTANLDGIGEGGVANERRSSGDGVTLGDSPLSKACKNEGIAGGSPAVERPLDEVDTFGRLGIDDGEEADRGGGKSLPTGKGNFPLSDGKTF